MKIMLDKIKQQKANNKSQINYKFKKKTKIQKFNSPREPRVTGQIYPVGTHVKFNCPDNL